MHGLALSLLPEYLDDSLESGRADGVTLARCPENVQVLETPLQGDLHLFAEDILHQVFVFVPRDFAGHQNCLRVTGHVIILYCTQIGTCYIIWLLAGVNPLRESSP